ncbi:PH domain-containing protein [Flavobacterium sp.]|uniref:PH domain-containing protein n=1 Tax=Flavobacterium sp. TaxID=239 RepID=UPI0026277787|nr:PH domain-containing protein [Flavobacterium sp.]
MKVDFSAPQKQSAVGIVVMFFDTIRHFIKAFWVFLVVYILKPHAVGSLYVFAGLMVLLVLFAIIAYLKFRNFTFFLDERNDEFVITEGILNKSRTTINLNKIQQVNIKQSLLQKIIGVHSLDVDTAGSSKEEVVIKAISHDIALALKTRLLEHGDSKIEAVERPTEVITIEETKPFVKISFSSLLKMGITSNYIKSFLLLLAFFFSTYENVQHFYNDTSIDTDQIGHYTQRFNLFEMVIIVLVLLFAVIIVINVFRMVFRYFNYTIQKQQGSLLLSFGLLNTKNTILKPERVQIAVVTQNYFQKKMNILQLRIKQATAGEKEQKNTAIEIPGCNELERDEILKLIFHRVPQRGLMLKPNWRKLGFAVFLTIIIPVFGFYLVVRYSGNVDPQLYYFVAAYIGVLAILQYFKFRNSRIFIHDDFIIKQSGAWDISHEIIEPEKIQAVTTSQLFWHKSLNIGSLTLHTAGGNVSFQLGNFETIKAYANVWLYELETSDSNWM